MSYALASLPGFDLFLATKIQDHIRAQEDAELEDSRKPWRKEFTRSMIIIRLPWELDEFINEIGTDSVSTCFQLMAEGEKQFRILMELDNDPTDWDVPVLWHIQKIGRPLAQYVLA